LVLGVFWKRATATGATLGMASGLLLTVYYMVRNEAWMRDTFGISVPVDLWFGIQPISAGVFGVALGFAVMVATSLLTRPGDERVDQFTDAIRYPD
jgi:cation/acetate symporter